LSPARGASVGTWIGVVALVVVGAFFLRWVLRSDAQRISDAVDEARDALVESRDADFLAFFTDDVTYQRGGDLAKLRHDLARWHGAGISEVFVVQRDVELRLPEADVHLVVAVGPELLEIARVDVDLVAVKGDDGIWRVRSFSWRRP